MFSINNFRSDIFNRGLLRNNRGSIVLPVPPGLKTKIDARDIAIRCDRMVLPGVWFAKQEGHRRYGYGPTDTNPEAPSFDPIVLSFVVDKRGEVYQFFAEWMGLITSFNSTKGLKNTNAVGALPYESTYPIEYVVDMNLLAYDEDEQKILKYHLTRAWPAVLEEKEVAHANQDQFISLSITFAYRDWSLEGSNNSLFSDFLNFGENQLEKVSEKFMTRLVDGFI